jgi:glycerol-3-phosphate dehydrogenase
MAEETVDLASRKLGVERPCRTAETLIDPPGTPHHALRDRLAASEVYPRPELVCECELVSRADVEAALRRSGSLVLNDLRRDLRVGMGPCQAGFCAYRAAGLLHQLEPGNLPPDNDAPADPAAPLPASLFAGPPNVAATNSALLEFLQERWKGIRPVMWGANLRQMELDLNIYRNLFGAERLPTIRPPEAYPTEKTA